MTTPSVYLHEGEDSDKSFCTTDINKKYKLLTEVHGLAIEALGTGIFVFLACAVWDSRNAKNTDSVPIKFGLAIAGLAFAIAPYTGCGLNPARSFGPAVWNNHWDHHWIFWVGPIGGAIITALIYRCLFSPKTKKQESDTENFNGVET